LQRQLGTASVIEEVIYKSEGALTATDSLQEITNLWLEENYKRNDTHAYQLAQDSLQQLHIQSAHHNPYEVDDDNTRENIWCVGTARHTVDTKHKECYEQYID
jgi:hypothetical protein